MKIWNKNKFIAFSMGNFIVVLFIIAFFYPNETIHEKIERIVITYIISFILMSIFNYLTMKIYKN